MERQRELQIIDVEVQSDQDNAHFRIDKRRFSRGDPPEVVGRDVASVLRIRAADERHVFGREFLLDTRFAEHEDFAFVGGQIEDAGDVDCSAVGGGEDLILWLECCVLINLGFEEVRWVATGLTHDLPGNS